MKLPDGRDFPFWDDATKYTRTIHVAQKHPDADDANDGSADAPFATVGRAAAVLAPGEKVIIHEGIYREHVAPQAGGSGPDAMIAYEAAPGEQVVLCGSRVVEGPFAPSEGWRIGIPDNGATIWQADLRPEWFVGYNPFMADNLTAYYCTFNNDWKTDETHRLQLRRGILLAGGVALRQVLRARDLAESDGCFWVEDPGLRVHFRLPGDVDPRETVLEATVQEQVFAPRQRGLGYIRLKGLTIRHAGDGVPVPQRAMLSTTRGHHWIVEDCDLSWCNVGIDLGKQSWDAPDHAPAGGHIVRRNIIADCGVCGIAGTSCVDGSLIEDNLIERIGWRQIERIWECAGLKMHHARDVLFRRNVFRHISQACGIWLDIGNVNCRITQNVFADIETYLGACFIECTHFENLVDGNLFADIRDIAANVSHDPNHNPGGAPVKTDSGEYLTVAHNLFVDIPDNYAIMLSLAQNQRIVQGRTGLCRRNAVCNNLLVATPKRVVLGMTRENACDGNVYDARNDNASLCIESPAPKVSVDLAAWRDFFGYDGAGAQVPLEGRFDAASLQLQLAVQGDLPRPVEVQALHGDPDYPLAGPLSQEQWKALRQGQAVRLFDPARLQ